LAGGLKRPEADAQVYAHLSSLVRRLCNYNGLFHGLNRSGDKGIGMLLRRITQHVKDQNWFAVLLDFVIVVAGILIAFWISSVAEKRGEMALFER
jgi:hypothetical protein